MNCLRIWFPLSLILSTATAPLTHGQLASAAAGGATTSTSATIGTGSGSGSQPPPDSADADGDGLSNHDELYVTGSDPALKNTDFPQDPDGNNDPTDLTDGWPRVAWLHPARLPEVRYAIIRLQSVGWPAGIPASELDDKGNVLSQPWTNGSNLSYRFWKAATQAIEITPWTVSASVYPYLNGPITRGKQLGRNGHVVDGSSSDGVKRKAIV